MPEFLEDPSVLTKDKLKNELVANNVSLPAGEQRKDVYVQLYLQHLTSRNRGTPDFSSDEEREATPMRGRGRPPGRKATKKTDKSRTEEKNQDVSELSNEALKEELIKYGMNPGPILGNTRKVYEQRLIKLKGQGLASSASSVADSSTAESNKQNGNTDSEQYSDDEPDTKIELTLEKREPLRGKQRSQVTLRSRTETSETAEDAEVTPELNVKRSSRSPPKEFTSDVEGLSTCQANISEEAVTETSWTPAKSGRLQMVSKESARISRRTPRKKVVAAEAEPLPFDDSEISETPPVTETIMPSSNQNLAYTSSEPFESQPIVDEVPESFRRAETLLSVTEFSEFSRRTPKKQLISEKIVEKTYVEEKRAERDVLKEMFPHEISTPTGISASCRRPIKGAAGRPLNLKDLKMDERYGSTYIPKYSPMEIKSAKVKTGRSIPMWIKILLFVVVALFSFLVYQAMETNEGNYFSKLLQGISDKN
ncbi:thymopoietin isoform 1-T1 [Rhinophrynus dorsalis]